MTNTANKLFPGIVKTVFLDRDGVLNQKLPEGRFVTNWSEFHLLPKVVESMVRLNRAGIRTVVVSNQRGIALGLYTAADVHAIHAAFAQHLASYGAHVDAFYFCPHNKDECNCRKPSPGMFEQAVGDFAEIKAASSLIIGDALSDIEFGRRLGMKTIFIDGAHETQKPGAEIARQSADLCFISLAEAVDALLAH